MKLELSPGAVCLSPANKGQWRPLILSFLNGRFDLFAIAIASLVPSSGVRSEDIDYAPPRRIGRTYFAHAIGNVRNSFRSIRFRKCVDTIGSDLAIAAA